MSPAWLRAAVLAEPRRFSLLRAAEALPGARLMGPRSLAVPAHEVEAATPLLVQTAVLGLAGASSPLPAGMAQELARLDQDSAAAGLHSAIEQRLLGLLLLLLRRRAVDDAEAHAAQLDRLAGPLDEGERGLAGRLCDGRTADALAQRLAAVAGCPVNIVAATGGSLPIGPGAGNLLGRQILGSGQVLGEAVAAQEFGCRITLGPMAPALATRLRPSGQDHRRLLAALSRGLPPCLRWRLDLLVMTMEAGALGERAVGLDLRLDGERPVVERELLAAG